MDTTKQTGGQYIGNQNSTTPFDGLFNGAKNLINAVFPNPTGLGNKPKSIPVNTNPLADQVSNANGITLPKNTSNVDNSLRATTDAYMSTPPAPAPNYDASTGFLTPAGKAAGMKATQPNDPAGGSMLNSGSMIKDYLGGNSNPSSINNGNLIPDTSGNTNNAYLNNYTGLNDQLGNQNNVRTDLNSQFGVDTKQQNYIDAFNQYNSKKVSYDQQIEKLYNTPGMTKEQADTQAAGLQRANNADLANLAVVTQAAQGNYTTALDIVQRKMDAQFKPIQEQIDNYKAIVQSPNSNLTASQSKQIEANMFGLQNNLTNTKNALSTGSQILIQNGLYTADIGKQLDAAQTPEQVNSIISNAMTGAGLNYGTDTQGGGTTQSIPPILAGAVATSPGGQQYIDESKLTPGREAASINAAKEAGIPVLKAGDVEAVRNIDYVKQNIKGMEGVIDNILSPGLGGRVKGLVSNPIKNFLQTNTDISTFNGYRDTAIKIIQSLAGGVGSGLRLNASEIDTATNNIPTISDNLETAQNKIGLLNSFLDNKMSTVFPNSSNNRNAGGSGGTTGTGITNSKGQVTSASF
jgi:hypothetical protein